MRYLTSNIKYTACNFKAYKKYFNNCIPTFGPPCIDDIFSVFGDDQICEHFMNILNSQHQNLKFAIEKATQSLSFLDVKIKLLKGVVESLVWRIPSHTGLLLNFNTICPKT